MPTLSVDPARLKAARIAAGYRREEIATVLGIAYGTICAYENGSITPSAPRLLALASAYGVAVEQLCSIRPEQAAS